MSRNLVILGIGVLSAIVSVVRADAGSQTRPVDVCALLPGPDFGTIVGHTGVPVRTRAAKTANGGSECRYVAGARGSVTIYIGGGEPKASWDEAMKILQTSGATLQPLAGVGDGAFFWDTRVYAHIGTYEVTISTTPQPGDDENKIKANAAALAKAVIAKLK